MRKAGWRLRAAGNARQTVEERDGGAGVRHAGVEYAAGVFTAFWVAKQSGERVRWSVPAQHPQFYATWAYESCDRAAFGVPLGEGRGGAAGPHLVMYSQPDKR